MAGKQTLLGEVEINCSPNKLLEMFKGKQHHIPNICSDKIPAVVAHHDDWTTVGSTTRRWDYVYQGEYRHIIEKFEEIDEENNTIIFSIIGGDIMEKYYKSLKTTLEAVPKGERCLVKWKMEYEKLNDDAPEPQAEMDTIMAMAKDIGDHHANNP